MGTPDALSHARARVLGARGPAFLVDAGGLIRNWNTAAGWFFGIAAWDASAHPCFEVLRCPAWGKGCPLLVRRRQVPARVVCFELPGVPAARVRHTAVVDADGALVGLIHELTRAVETT